MIDYRHFANTSYISLNSLLEMTNTVDVKISLHYKYIYYNLKDILFRIKNTLDKNNLISMVREFEGNYPNIRKFYNPLQDLQQYYNVVKEPSEDYYIISLLDYKYLVEQLLGFDDLLASIRRDYNLYPLSSDSKIDYKLKNSYSVSNNLKSRDIQKSTLHERNEVNKSEILVNELPPEIEKFKEDINSLQGDIGNLYSNVESINASVKSVEKQMSVFEGVIMDKLNTLLDNVQTPQTEIPNQEDKEKENTEILKQPLDIIVECEVNEEVNIDEENDMLNEPSAEMVTELSKALDAVAEDLKEVPPNNDLIESEEFNRNLIGNLIDSNVKLHRESSKLTKSAIDTVVKVNTPRYYREHLEKSLITDSCADTDTFLYSTIEHS